jgi:hypothetical protein
MNDIGDPKKIDLIDQVELPPVYRDEKVEAKVANACNILTEHGITLNPMVLDYFKDPDLYNSLPADIKESDARMAEYIGHSMAFGDYFYKARTKRWSGDDTGFFGKEMAVPETMHHNGRVRREEEGYKININALAEAKINPSKVLFFRITQPSEEPKPEYYWTSDFHEVMRGLTAEIPKSQREAAVVLVADLETINGNEGLIQDINDDQGLAVRQIGQGPFDQTKCLAKFKPSSQK